MYYLLVFIIVAWFFMSLAVALAGAILTLFTGVLIWLIEVIACRIISIKNWIKTKKQK